MPISIVKPTNGGDSDAWGAKLNAALDALLAGVNGSLALADAVEFVQDAVGAMVVAGTGVSVAYNDTAGTLTISATGGGGGSTDVELVRDTIAAALTSGANITVTPNDAADTITIAVTGLSTVATSGSYTDLSNKPTIPAAYTDEQAQDAIAAAIVNGTQSGISVTYNDATNALNFSATGTTSPDATTSSKGIVQLAGDLGGTAAAPTVPGLAATTNASNLTSGTLAVARIADGSLPFTKMSGVLTDAQIPAGIARDTEVTAAVAALVNSAPSTLDTLGELATALTTNTSAAATLTTLVGTKAAQTDLTALTSVVDTKAPKTWVQIDPNDNGVLLYSVSTTIGTPGDTDPIDPPPVVTPPTGGTDTLDADGYPTRLSAIKAWWPGGSFTLDPYYVDPDDPYPSPVTIDRPPTTNGLPTGRLTNPHLAGYPCASNTGLRGVGRTIASLGTTILAYEHKITNSGAVIGGVTYTRPASGSPLVVTLGNGTLTLYPLTAGLATTELYADGSATVVHNVLDGVHLKGMLWTSSTYTNTIVKKCLIEGTTHPKGAFYCQPINAVGDQAQAGFTTFLDCRIHGGTNSQSTCNGNRYYTLRCDISGGNDALEPASLVYHDWTFAHGLRKVGTYHHDVCQIIQAVAAAGQSISGHFGGWAIRVRKLTGFSFGTVNGGQCLILGNQVGDMDRVLIQDFLFAGGTTTFQNGFGWYEGGYPKAADGSIVTKLSSITGQQESHPNTRMVVVDGGYVGRKAADGIPGCGDVGTDKVPRNFVFDRTGWTDYANGGKYGEGPPYTHRNVRWDDDNSLIQADMGYGTASAAANGWPTLEVAAAALGCDLTHYTYAPGA